MPLDLTPMDDLPAQPKRLTPEEHRYERFLELGFSRPQAKTLSRSLDKGVPVYWGDVADVLHTGCDHNTAFDIFRGR